MTPACLCLRAAGIDEGGKARERIERHLVEVLAPQGMRRLTSKTAISCAPLTVGDSTSSANASSLFHTLMTCSVRFIGLPDQPRTP